MNFTQNPSRVKALTDSSTSFFKSLRWSDLSPIEERLALKSVVNSGLFFLAPLVVLASVFVTWLLFPAEPGTDSLGFFYGTLSIVLMGWAFLLATRSRFLEWSFGGFDRLHVWHRWVGIAAVVFLFLHTNSENETRNGKTPFGNDVEEAGLVFASPAQVALVTLVIISILRILPYRVWRFSHIALIIPFVFSAFHALTAERPNAEFVISGNWLWLWSIIGVVAFAYRVLLIDSGLMEKKAVLNAVHVSNHNVRLTLSRSQPWPQTKAGKFVYIRIGGLWREAHPFSVVGDDNNPYEISVEMRRTGDWTDSVAARAKVGDVIRVSRTHGHLKLSKGNSPSVWVAGGSGITPFLQSEKTYASFAQTPVLIYFFRDEKNAIGINYLRQMNQKGLLHLQEVKTGESGSRDMSMVISALSPKAHVAVCGPRQLVLKVARLSRKARTRPVSFEIFDYRSPFGPDLNPLLKSLIRFILPQKLFTKMGWLFEKSKVDTDLRPSSSTQIEASTL
jgi:predicted ferric reductase